MKVERSDLNPTKVKLVVSGDANDLAPIKNHVLAHFRHNVKIPGFRAGTAPVALIEKHIDQKQLIDEFLDHALNQLYSTSTKQEGLKPVSQPNVQLKKFVPFTDLEMEVEVDVLGKVALPEYKKIKLPKTPVKVTAKEVDEIIKSLQIQAAERVEVNSAAKKGDETIIDFSGKDKAGKPLNGTDAEDYPLIIGSSSFIPGFEDNLVGLKTGAKKKFNVKFPEDYGVAAFQGKDVEFEVTLKKVNELKLPEIDDKFAAKAGPFKTLAELKADIKKELARQKQQQADRDYENKLLQEIVTKSSIKIPESLIVAEIERLEEEEKRNLVYQGKTWQEHLKEEGITEQQHKDRQRPQAEERIKGGLVLSEIADLENITVERSEVEGRIEILKGQYQDQTMRAELDRPEVGRDIEARLITEKTISKLLGYSSN